MNLQYKRDKEKTLAIKTWDVEGQAETSKKAKNGESKPKVGRSQGAQ